MSTSFLYGGKQAQLSAAQVPHFFGTSTSSPLKHSIDCSVRTKIYLEKLSKALSVENGRRTEKKAIYR